MNKLEMTIDSREVAKMVEKQHNKLLRDVESYIDQLAQSKIGHSDFFQESLYIDKNNRQRPCYNVTKKGCEFIAHKLTGVKGAAFTARYINKFHDMEDVIDGKRIMSKKEALNRKKNNWYGRNNEKIENILLSSGWGKKYLYHRILTEVSDVWDSNYLKAMYKSKNGYYPRYAMDIIDTFQEVRDVADAYIDFLYNKFYIDEDYLIEEFEEEF